MKVVKYWRSSSFFQSEADICMELSGTRVRQIRSKRGMEMMCCVNWAQRCLWRLVHCVKWVTGRSWVMSVMCVHPQRRKLGCYCFVFFIQVGYETPVVGCQVHEETFPRLGWFSFQMQNGSWLGQHMLKRYLQSNSHPLMYYSCWVNV